MRALFFSIILLLIFTNFLSSQSNTFSIYVGGQIPNEVALLDFGGNGPADVFKPGWAVGGSIERNWKILGLRGDLDFTSNGLKDESTGFTSTVYKGDLYNFYGRAYVNLNLISGEISPILSIGIGPGLLVGIVPETTYNSDVVGSEFTLERRVEASLALCTSVRLNLPVTEKIGFYAALNNDLIGYYADIESVAYTNVNLGVTFAL